MLMRMYFFRLFLPNSTFSMHFLLFHRLTWLSLGLIFDLFPALDVPRKRDQEFEKTVKQAANDMLLQPEDNFILKVVQLEELLEVSI